MLHKNSNISNPTVETKVVNAHIHTETQALNLALAWISECRVLIHASQLTLIRAVNLHHPLLSSVTMDETMNQ